MRHQNELARIPMLAGLPGQTLGKLGERMERQSLSPGEQKDVQGQLVAVLSGLAHAKDAGGGRAAVEPGSTVDEGAVTLRALTPVTIVWCSRAVYDEVVGSRADA
jgi:hypothetical protein